MKGGPRRPGRGRLGLRLAVLAGLYANGAAAQDDTGPLLDTEDMAVVDVQVDRDMAREIPRDSAVPVSVVDVKKYAGRATDLSELLDRAAGVKVRQTGGAGSAVNISVRGLQGRRVTILIDGQPLDSPDGSFGINDLPLQLIDRIEVYKGVVPARFGGDGLGSAVNIVLRDRALSYADLGYGYGSYSVQRAFAFGKHVDLERGFQVGAGAVANLARNDYLMPRDGGPSVRRSHDGFRSVLAGSALELNQLWFDKAKLEVAGVFSEKELQGIPPVGDSGVSQYDIREGRTRNQIILAAIELEKYAALPGLDLSYDLSVPYFRGNFRDLASTVYDFDGGAQPNPNGRGEVGRGPNDSDNRRLDVRQTLNVSYALDAAHSLNLHHDLFYTHDAPSDPVANAAAGVDLVPAPGELVRSIASLAHEAHLFDDRWVIVGAAKHSYFAAEGTLTSAYDLVTATPDRVRQDRGAFGASVASRFRLFRPLLLKASFEHAVRLPSAAEVFGDGFVIQGSPALSPETSDNLNVGLYFDENIGMGRLSLELTAFASQIRNLITLGGTLTRNYANVGAATLRGVEVDARADLGRWLSAYGNVTDQHLVNDAELIAGTNQPNYLRGLAIPNVPRFYCNWGAELHGDGLPVEGARARLFYDGTYVDEYFYEYEVSANQSRRLPRYVVHTLGLQQTFENERYSANLEVNNIANVPRADAFNVPLPGRTVRFLLRMTLL